MTAVEVQDALADAAQAKGADWSLRVDVGHETMWAGELRWTPNPMRPDGPDRSMTFYGVAANSPDEVAETLYRDFLAWRAEAPPVGGRRRPMGDSSDD